MDLINLNRLFQMMYFNVQMIFNVLESMHHSELHQITHICVASMFISSTSKMDYWCRCRGRAVCEFKHYLDMSVKYSRIIIKFKICYIYFSISLCIRTYCFVHITFIILNYCKDDDKVWRLKKKLRQIIIRLPKVTLYQDTQRL